MKKIAAGILLLASLTAYAAGAESVNVMGKTADCFGCIKMLTNYECDEHGEGTDNIEFGSLTADLDGDGDEETVSVYSAAMSEDDPGYEYFSIGNAVNISVADPTDGTVCRKTLWISYNSDLVSHTGTEWTDAQPSEGEPYAFLRAYLFGDAPYIAVEYYSNALLYGDGETYSVNVFRYDGSGLETVCDAENAGSDPCVYDAGLIRDMAEIGYGNIDLEQLWYGSGLMCSIPDPVVPIAGAVTVPVSDNYEDYGMNAVKVHYEETGETQVKIAETHVFSAEEMAAGCLRTRAEDTDGWFAMNAEYYSQGTLTVGGAVSVRTLASASSEEKLALAAGEQIAYGGFSMNDENGDPWYCVLYGNTYGFIPESGAVLSE